MRRAACIRVFGQSGLSLLLAFSVLATSVACSRSSPSRNAADFSVVIVTLDTTRADRIGAFGGTAVPTPRLDEMARQGTAFTAAFAQAPLTLPSHASIFTSKYPASHGVRHNGVFRLRGADTTLAERLKEASFATAAVIGAFVLNSGYGIEQGFDVYSDIPKQRFQGGRDQLYEAQRTADEVNAEVFRWLDSRPAGRFFLWVHYYDPHYPYDPPQSPRRTLEGTDYDREISYVDHCFGDLVDRLRADRILDNVILVVAGDHGESLGSHLELTHGVFLYEPAVHVPLLMRAPGLVPEGRRIDAPVELVDIAPTVLDLLGLPALEGAQGRSLVRLARGEADGRGRLVYAETYMPRIEFGWSELRMVRDDRFKYIQAPRPELYDLRDDPGEARNVVTSDPERASEMASALREWVSSTTIADVQQDARRPVSAEEIAKLRSLGYLGGTADVDLAEDGRSRPDPKDHVEDGAIVHEARENMALGKLDEAVADLDGVLGRDPSNHLARSTKIQALVALKRYVDAEGEAWTALGEAMEEGDSAAPLVERARRVLASVLWMNGKNKEAETQYKAAIALNRTNDSAPVFPGILLGTASGLEEAQRIVAEVLDRNPDDPAAWAARFELQHAQRREAEALASARRLADLRAGDPETLVKAGRLARDANELPLAVRLFEIAHAKVPSSADVLGYLGTARLTAGDVAGAERDLLKVRKLRPGDPRAPFYLANIALLRNREPEAKEFIAESLRNDPEFLPPLLNYAQWLATRGRRAEAIGVTESALERRPGDPNAKALLESLHTAPPAGGG